MTRLFRLGSADRGELLTELLRAGHRGALGEKADLLYCRIELRDMWNKGYVDVSDIGHGRMRIESAR